MHNRKYKWDMVQAKEGILKVDRLLCDFPRYTELFWQYTIGSPQMFAYSQDVKRFIGETFDVKLSFHKPACVEGDLRKLGLPQIPETNSIAGYMSRLSVESDRCYIAVAAARPELDIVDIGLVMHEYGHYIEERVHLKERESPNYRSPGFVHRNTSMTMAFQLFAEACPSLPRDVIHYAADELVAWGNALWLCWLFGIDRQYVALGLVLDKISQSPDYPDFAVTHLHKIHKFFTNRAAAEALFSSGGYYPGFDNFFEQGDEHSRCLQIDTASHNLFAYLIYR